MEQLLKYFESRDNLMCSYLERIDLTIGDNDYIIHKDALERGKYNLYSLNQNNETTEVALKLTSQQIKDKVNELVEKTEEQQ